ncbi:MAG: single-stranded DNA-binding protein [Saprospiraceae bacterium]|nr:single-stranded DNA-binding protein [Saprospiraceae bacterium]
MKNLVTLIGHLGNDVKVTAFKGGSKKAAVSMATTSSYKNAKGEYVKETQWHNLIAWGNLAESMGKYLAKGTQVSVDGSIMYRTYKDANGVERYITEIKVDNFIKLEKSQNAKEQKNLEGAPLDFN